MFFVLTIYFIYRVPKWTYKIDVVIDKEMIAGENGQQYCIKGKRQNMNDPSFKFITHKMAI